MQHIERALFGATAEEAVEMRIELAARRAQQRIEQRLIAALEQDDEHAAEDQEHADTSAESA